MLGILEGNTDKLKTVCVCSETSEAISRIFYETWNLIFPHIFIRGMQCALLELLDTKEGSMLVKRERERVNRFFSTTSSL